MKRIIIIGCPGSGKSTLARLMGERLSLPVIHLDRLFWREGWVEAPKEEFDAALHEALNGERWIIDGNYARTLKERLSRADTAVFLDYPGRVCLWRVIKRIVKSYGRVRPDMSDGCPERLDPEFLGYVWSFRKKQRGKLLSALAEAENVNVITLRNKREYDKFVLTLVP